MIAPSPFFTAEHELFRASVRAHLAQQVAPQIDAWEAEGRIPASAWLGLGAQGFLGLAIPESAGGLGADLFFTVALCEELPRAGAGGFGAAVAVQQFIAPMAIAKHGSPELQARHVHPSVRGEAVGALAISEPDAGSDVARLRTVAQPQADGSWRLSGEKAWITNGVHGHFHVVAARTGPGEGAKGLTLFAIDRHRAGVQASPIPKAGWRCSDTALVSYQDVVVAEDERIGPVGGGFPLVMEAFDLERLTVAAIAIGGCLVALEGSTRYLKERQAFGRELSQLQALRHRLADLDARVSAARALVHEAAWRLEHQAGATAACAAAKLVATELHQEVAAAAVQLAGGAGYAEEYPFARHWRDARVETIVAGTSEIMREILARERFEGPRRR